MSNRFIQQSSKNFIIRKSLLFWFICRFIQRKVHKYWYTITTCTSRWCITRTTIVKAKKGFHHGMHQYVAPTVTIGCDNPFFHHIFQIRYYQHVTFTMFDGHSNPRIHLQRYHLEFVSFENDDDLLVKLFPLSLKYE